MAGSAVIGKQPDRVYCLPFAATCGWVAPANSPKACDMLLVAPDQHWRVLDAIERREDSRAESRMCEHSCITLRH